MDLALDTETEARAEQAQQLAAFSGINLRGIRAEVKEALTYFGSFGLLEEYTKHDMTHIDAMLGMYDWLIPPSTQQLMTPADWLLVTLSTYLHDFGLLITRDEFDARENCDGFVAYRKRIFDTDDSAVKDYRAQLEQMGPDADGFLYQEFVRSQHAQRIRSWLQPDPDPGLGLDKRVATRLRTLLSGVDETFREDIGVVCESHHLDDLNNLRKYPLSKPYGSTRGEEANVQYAAILLRTSDLLHVTRDRVPSMAALVVNPRNPKSQVEWAKQAAVRSVRMRVPAQPAEQNDPPPHADTIEVHASFKEAEGFFGLTSYLQYANRQIAQTFAWSRENQSTGESAYVFPWKRVDTTHIEAKGFIAEPFEFKIDQAKILDLLTGHTLYNDTGVVVRELAQNALDAVRLQYHLAKSPGYTPRIQVRWDSEKRSLEISDNGTGMTQTVIEQNFLRVGSSRYQDPQFLKDFPSFSSISRFGIGVLSTFMVADDVSVLTNHPMEQQARQLSLRDVHGQYLVRLVDKPSNDIPAIMKEHGTSVTLKLRPSAEMATSIEKTLRYWIAFPGCEVSLVVDNGEPVKIGHNTVGEALTDVLVESRMASLRDGALTSNYGAPIEIRTSSSNGREVAFAVAWTKWLDEWGFVRLTNPGESEEVERPVFGTFVEGVRVTTEAPGFRTGGIAAMSNLTGKRAPRTNVARSAIERTEEYDDALKDLYATYLRHVEIEMENFESIRESSLTRAAKEAGYLVQDLVRADVESSAFLTEELRGLPAIVVEEAGVRQRFSLKDLAFRDELVSVESTTIESFERVLSNVRGGSSGSLAGLLTALGGNQTLPSGALVCGLGRFGMFSRMFTSDWDVISLATDEGSRTLTTRWQRRGDAARWVPVPKDDVIPASLISVAQREVSFGNANDLNDLLFCVDGSIAISGFDETLVSCHGRLLVLPTHPFMTVEPVSDDVPESARLWAVGRLLGMLMPDRQRYRTPRYAVSVGVPNSNWVGNVLDTTRRVGLLTVLAEESLKSALFAPSLDVLDVHRWDRRTE